MQNKYECNYYYHFDISRKGFLNYSYDDDNNNDNQNNANMRVHNFLFEHVSKTNNVFVHLQLCRCCALLLQ